MFAIDDNLRKVIKQHFHKAFTEINEAHLMHAIQHPRSKYDVYWAVIGLRDCGTFNCIALLKSLSDYPMQDVKDCALLTIAHIGGASETPYFIHRLQDKGRKSHLLWAIEIAADQRAIDAVIAFVTPELKKCIKSDSSACKDGTIEALKYLNRIQLPASQYATFYNLLNTAWAKLPASIQTCTNLKQPITLNT